MLHYNPFLVRIIIVSCQDVNHQPLVWQESVLPIEPPFLCNILLCLTEKNDKSQMFGWGPSMAWGMEKQSLLSWLISSSMKREAVGKITFSLSLSLWLFVCYSLPLLFFSLCLSLCLSIMISLYLPCLFIICVFNKTTGSRSKKE